MRTDSGLKQERGFDSLYCGKVEDVNDPEKLMRVRVRVFGLFEGVSVEDLPWAEYLFPAGCRPNDGTFIPCKVGDIVVIQFWNGDTRKPLIMGSKHFAPDGAPNIPHESWNGSDTVTHKRTGDETEPIQPDYHKDVVFTQHGITVEIRRDKSFSITQRHTGSEINIDPEGNVIIHCEKNLWMSAPDNRRIIIGKDSKIEISGNEDVGIDGNETKDVGGNVSVTVGGNADIEVSGKVNLIGRGTIDIDGGSGVLMGAVQGSCLCMVTGKPHAHISGTVKVSL